MTQINEGINIVWYFLLSLHLQGLNMNSENDASQSSEHFPTLIGKPKQKIDENI